MGSHLHGCMGAWVHVYVYVSEKEAQEVWGGACGCVCVRACEREGERDVGRHRETQRELRIMETWDARVCEMRWRKR